MGIEERRQRCRHERNLNGLAAAWAERLANYSTEWLSQLASDLANGCEPSIELPIDWPLMRDMLAAWALFREVQRRVDVAELE